MSHPPTIALDGVTSFWDITHHVRLWAGLELHLGEHGAAIIVAPVGSGESTTTRYHDPAQVALVTDLIARLRAANETSPS